jgi:hypothetical protein
MAAACAPAMETPRVVKTTTEQFNRLDRILIRKILYYSDGMRVNIDRVENTPVE